MRTQAQNGKPDDYKKKEDQERVAGGAPETFNVCPVDPTVSLLGISPREGLPPTQDISGCLQLYCLSQQKHWGPPGHHQQESNQIN